MTSGTIDRNRPRYLLPNPQITRNAEEAAAYGRWVRGRLAAGKPLITDGAARVLRRHGLL